MNLKKLLPIIGIIILMYILSTIDVREIINVFSTINPWYALLSFCSIIPIVLFANYQWQLVLKKHSITVGFWYSLKNIFIGYFYGFITPGGLGAYTRVLYLKGESGETLHKCFVNVLMFNPIDYITLLSLGVIGGFVLSSRFPSILPIFSIVFLIMLFLLVVFIRKETGKTLFKKLLQSKIFNPFKDRLNAHVDALYEDIPTFKDLVFPFFISLVGWIIRFSEFYIISMLFSINVNYIYFILIIAVADVIASLPISVYGLGTREVTLIGLFSIFSVMPANVISLSLFWFVLVWLFPSIIGAGVTILESRHGKLFNAKTMTI